MLLLKHTNALIELLSVLPDETLLELGLSHEEVEDLHEVFLMSCGHYENIVGRRHPAEERGGQIDDDLPTLVVIPPRGAQN